MGRKSAFSLAITLTFDLPTLQNFSAMPTHVIYICGKFRWNHCTVYGYIVSREMGVSSGRMNRLHENTMLFPPIIVGGDIETYCTITSQLCSDSTVIQTSTPDNSPCSQWVITVSIFYVGRHNVTFQCIVIKHIL